ncbi:sulfatase-like hydrolase/transferase [Paenibacillus sp. 1P07SE]|uniref:sulfatase-like hydrolase/transferase n=1 Tax=Paenibacillus sp. 1P07SE TaxID=3132209 RepID=UPI0039A4E116
MSKRPNIICIVADDHRYSAIGAAGLEAVHTPVLDELARQGASFRQSHMLGGVLQAVCAPARAALHAGMSPFRAAVSTEDVDSKGAMTIREERPLLAETLRGAGYRTYAIGKWHNDKASFQRSFGGGDRLFFRGYSDPYETPTQPYDPEGLYPEETKRTEQGHASELFADAATAFIEGAEEREPFFLYIGFTAPHDPRRAPERYHRMYDPAQLLLPPNVLARHPFDNGELEVRDEQLAPLPRTETGTRAELAAYYAMITHLDAQIGRILQSLEASGKREDTVIIYTADHGIAIGSHGLMGKQNMYEHSVRIPLIISGAGIPSGAVIESLTCTYDLYPTVCELASVPVPGTAEGHNLLPLIRGEQAEVRAAVGSAYRYQQRMIKTRDWKLIRYWRHPQTGAGVNRMQLFHLTEDPWELRDLYGDPAHRELADELSLTMKQWLLETGDPLAASWEQTQPNLPMEDST